MYIVYVTTVNRVRIVALKFISQLGTIDQNFSRGGTYRFIILQEDDSDVNK